MTGLMPRINTRRGMLGWIPLYLFSRLSILAFRLKGGTTQSIKPSSLIWRWHCQSWELLRVLSSCRVDFRWPSRIFHWFCVVWLLSWKCSLGKLCIGSPGTWIPGSAVQHGDVPTYPGASKFWVFNQLFSIPPRQWDWISHVSVCEWHCTNMYYSFWFTHYIRIDLHDNSSSTQGEHATYETMMRYWSFQFQRWAISEMGAIWINVP